MNELAVADSELWIENHPLSEIRIGACAGLKRTVTKSD